MTNANVSETFLSFLHLNGSYHDLTKEWYNDIASSLITTMLFNAYWPLIEFSYTYGIKFLFRFLDRGFSFKANGRSKKFNIQ